MSQGRHHCKADTSLKKHIAVCSLSQHQGSTESRKTLEQKLIFQIVTLNPQRTLFIQLI